jgi:ankyrin repeat protein
MRMLLARGQPLVVPILAGAGVPIDGRRSDSMTPLHVAACYGHLDVLLALIRAGASVNEVDKYGRTALHLAVYWRHEVCVPALVQAGADVGLKDDKGNPAVHYARERGANEECVRLLEQATRR